jgi:hypothetical protein
MAWLMSPHVFGLCHLTLATHQTVVN